MDRRERAVAGVRRFTRANQRVAERVQEHLPPDSNAFYHHYDDVVAERLADAPAPLVVDVGGGRTCSYASRVPEGMRVVAVDVDGAELAHNGDVHERRVADVSRGLPFETGEVGVLTSRAVLEHVSDVDAFVADSARVLAPGGWAVHLLPGRNALFALAARGLPFDVAKRALHLVRPETEGVVEFPVHYDRGIASELDETFRGHGFTDVGIQACYSQAGYFDWLLPAYVACVAYENVVRRFGRRDLAAYYLVIARR